jgi:alkanesulfonate monooxygenase SsuD/methylene tetrahydromethanopterin reductase-like flavin-dependent oxidoreductase (luciferase family)
MALSILRLDMRAPAFSPVAAGDLYATALDMSVWAEKQGFTMVVLSEHHGVDDGYLPSPLTLAGAIAGRTRSIPISVMALLLPLYDPVRLAEDLAVLDLASGGRLGITAGLGYRPEEYAMLGADWQGRGRVMDEHLDVLLRAWRGETFEWHGRPVRVTPQPGSRPHPFLAVGGSGRNAARRAARFGLPFQPAVQDPEIFDLYTAECERRGHVPLVLQPGAGNMLWVSEDPDRSWSELGRYLLHHAMSYASWQTHNVGSVVDSQATTVEELRAEGKYRILTPDEFIGYTLAHPESPLVHFPLCGGTPPELGWPSLELFASKVLPRLGAPETLDLG